MKVVCVVLYLLRVCKVSRSYVPRYYRLSKELAEEALAKKFPKETEPGLGPGCSVFVEKGKMAWEGPLWVDHPSKGRYKVFAVSWARRGALWSPSPESGQHSDSKQASRVGH